MRKLSVGMVVVLLAGMAIAKDKDPKQYPLTLSIVSFEKDRTLTNMPDCNPQFVGCTNTLAVSSEVRYAAEVEGHKFVIACKPKHFGYVPLGGCGHLALQDYPAKKIKNGFELLISDGKSKSHAQRYEILGESR